MKIGIVDIGLGNVNSVARAFHKLGADAGLIGEASGLGQVDKIVFPGVGHYGEAAAKIEAGGFGEALRTHVQEQGKPILGICLGMQLLGIESEEGSGRGLGLIQEKVTRLNARSKGLPLPHIGWNDVTHAGMEMFSGIPSGTSFYFVHTFALPPEVKDCKTAVCEYGQPFTAALQSGHIWGTQFHPEKSQQAGLRLLQNFLAY